MNSLFSRPAESSALFFLVCFLASNAFFNAVFGFSLPLFLGTLPLSVGVAFFFPRAGLVAALLVTLFFERFFTLESFVIAETTYKLYPLDLILGACLFSGLLLFLKHRSEFLRFRSYDAWLLSFLLLVSVLLAFSLSHGASGAGAVAFSTWKNYVFYGVLVWLVGGLLRTRADLVAFTRLFFWGLAAAGIFLVIGLVRGGGLWTEYTPLSTAGTRYLAFPHAFYFALGLLTLLLALPYWLGRVGRGRTRLYIGGSIFLLLGVLGSLMRHLWLGLGGTLLMAFVVSPRIYGRAIVQYGIRLVLPGIFLLATAVLGMVLFSSSSTSLSLGRGLSVVQERLLSIGNNTDESLVWRGAVWSSTLERFRANPWFGIGFGASVPVEIGDYQEFVEVRNMHNSWLALLMQTGVVGLFLFGGFLFSLMREAWRLTLTDAFLRQVRFVLFGLLFFQALVFFSQPYLETNLLGVFFWLTLGLVRALCTLAQENDSVSVAP